jgi:hypothetical protein
MSNAFHIECACPVRHEIKYAIQGGYACGDIVWGFKLNPK